MPRGQGGGPKTPEGRARSSRNAVKHALRDPKPYIIEGLESPEEWEEFRLGVIDAWNAVGVMEVEFATNVAYGLWKLRRCHIHESRQLSKQVYEVEEELRAEDGDEDDDDAAVGAPHGHAPTPAEPVEIDPEDLVKNQELEMIPNGWHIDRMLRNEAFVRKALVQDMRELEMFQARRRGVHAPINRVVFSYDPSPAKVRLTANDLPEFQVARQNVRMAEAALAARRLAAKEG